MSDKATVEYAGHTCVTDGEEPYTKVHAKTWIVLMSINFVYLAQLIALVGSGFLAQDIFENLGASASSVWPNTILVMLTVILNPSVTQASDYFGRRWFLIICNIFGVAGTLIISRSHNVTVAIVGYVICGLGFGSQALLNAIASEVLPRRYRPIAQATTAMSCSLGAIVALVVGGFLIRGGNTGNFRIFFYIVAALFAMSALGIWIGYNPPPRPLQSLTIREKLGSLDWIGNLLFLPALALLCIALAWSNNPYEWTNARILAPFLISTVLLAAFGFYEGKLKADGVLNHRLMKHRNFPLSVGIIFAEGATFVACNQYYPFQTGVFTGSDKLISALHLAVPQATALVLTVIAGAYSTRTKKIHYAMVLGTITLCVFNIMMCTVTLSTPAVSFWWYGLFAGAGNGIVAPLIFVAAQISTPPDLIALASGLLIAARSLGATVVLAIATAVLNNQLTHAPAMVAAAVSPLGLPESSLGHFLEALNARDDEMMSQVPGVTGDIVEAGIHALKACYAIGFRNIWIVATAFCVLATVGAFFIVDLSSEFTRRVDAPVEVKLPESQDARQKGAEKEQIATVHLETQLME